MARTRHFAYRFGLLLVAASFVATSLGANVFATASTSTDSGLKIDTIASATNVHAIGDKDIDFVDGTLTFSSTNYIDNQSDTNGAVGLVGKVKNSTSEPVFFALAVKYYDADGNMIASTNNTHYAPADSHEVSFVDMTGIYNLTKSYSKFSPTSYSAKATVLVGSPLTGTTENSMYSYEDYYYKRYNVDIDVAENETFSITEDMDAYFNVAKHGIIRHIPRKYTTTLSSSTTQRRTKLSNVAVNNEYSLSTDSDNYDIKIGSASKTITGLTNYVIKYDYQVDTDKSNEYDEFYHNIVEDSVPIENISFSVKMPKEFDISKIGFTSGSYGSKSNDVIFYVDGNTIHGWHVGGLSSYGAVTIRIELPDGYYQGAGIPYVWNQSYFNSVIVVLAVLLAITVVLWFIFGRNRRVVETVEFYPPDGVNSLDAGFIYRGHVVNRDVVSLLVYLAGKGYLKIAETSKRLNRSFKIIKLKDYDGEDENEKMFMDGMFSDGKAEVLKSDLYDSFYSTVNKIIENENKKENRQTIFEKGRAKINVIVGICAVVSLFFPFVTASFDMGSTDFIGPLFSVVFMLLFFTPFFYIIGKGGREQLASRIFASIIAIGMFLAMITSTIKVITSITIDVNPVYIVGALAGFVCAVVEVVFMFLMPKRTKYGAEMLGKVKGFRHFLETAEKSRINTLVAEDPEYFYKVLPYAYVLGVSDKWIKKFEDIAMTQPDWYESAGTFAFIDFSNHFDESLHSMGSAMTYEYHSYSSGSSGGSDFSSGGFGGGGDSGGGGGGGGSSSW